ncbi:hypothetical protein ACGFR6_04305 [Streptomyces sp. NPDC048567]|uniref:hypothetical protein n=1 Tax=Streptomyces sp. NPDC048567 TaxID=3365570 RepID=UPI00371F6A30
MSILDRVLVAPVDGGGEFFFAHAFDSGIRVWTRGLVRRVDERPRKPHGVAAPLYGGGTIGNMAALRDFVTDFVDHAADAPVEQLKPSLVRDTVPLVLRTDMDSVTSRMHFSYCAFSPMHTIGAWDAAGPELLLARVERERSGIGYFATGLPELPADAALDALPAALPAAAISLKRAENLSEYLHAPAGPVLDHAVSGRSARR